MRRLLLALALLLALPPAALRAEDGRTLVTVVGAIGQTNRGPFDPFQDALLGNLAEPFERAFAFDAAALAALPQGRLTLSYPNWDGAGHVFTGPLLAGLLAAVGATGQTVSVMAVDGYLAEFTPAEIAAAGMVLATAMDGRPLAIGGHGPAWLVFPPGSVPRLPGPKDDGLVWAVILIGVQ
jgi:hypothetical protein